MTVSLTVYEKFSVKE